MRVYLANKSIVGFVTLVAFVATSFLFSMPLDVSAQSRSAFAVNADDDKNDRPPEGYKHNADREEPKKSWFERLGDWVDKMIPPLMTLNNFATLLLSGIGLGQAFWEIGKIVAGWGKGLLQWLGILKKEDRVVSLAQADPNNWQVEAHRIHSEVFAGRSGWDGSGDFFYLITYGDGTTTVDTRDNLCRMNMLDANQCADYAQAMQSQQPIPRIVVYDYRTVITNPNDQVLRYKYSVYDERTQIKFAGGDDEVLIPWDDVIQNNRWGCDVDIVFPIKYVVNGQVYIEQVPLNFERVQSRRTSQAMGNSIGDCPDADITSSNATIQQTVASEADAPITTEAALLAILEMIAQMPQAVSESVTAGIIDAFDERGLWSNNGESSIRVETQETTSNNEVRNVQVVTPTGTTSSGDSPVSSDHAVSGEDEPADSRQTSTPTTPGNAGIPASGTTSPVTHQTEEDAIALSFGDVVVYNSGLGEFVGEDGIRYFARGYFRQDGELIPGKVYKMGTHSRFETFDTVLTRYASSYKNLPQVLEATNQHVMTEWTHARLEPGDYLFIVDLEHSSKVRIGR